MAVPASSGTAQGLQAVPVTTSPQGRIWNELAAAEHPHGTVLHLGARMGQPIESVHSLLGAIGFAASALAFAARDEWIGWQSQMRRKRLRCVPILSRLLIRPASLPVPSQGGVPVPPRAASPGVECRLVPVNQRVVCRDYLEEISSLSN